MRAELERLLARPVDVVRLRERMNRRLRQRILQEARYV
jgi:predicted nucleotidyltransferase